MAPFAAMTFVSASKLATRSTSTTRATPSGAQARTAVATSVAPVVHDELGSGAGGEARLLLRADRRGSARACEAGELDRRVADRARAAMDEHRSARDRTVGMQTAMRGQRRNAETRRLVERDLVGKRDGPAGVDRDPLGGCSLGPLPLAFEQPDPLADTRRVDAFADGGDLACAVLAWDHEGVTVGRASAAA